MRPALLRPPLLVSGRTSDFSGVVLVISTKSATLEPRRPGVVGLYLRIPHCLKSSVPVVSMSLRWPGHPTEPPKMSIEPSLRVTIARLVFLRLPRPNLVRRVFALAVKEC
jgi:hypothetical protein